MSKAEREAWEVRHRDASPGTPEPSLIEFMPLIPRGLVLDLAAGTGRNAIALAHAGFKVVAVDFSRAAMRITGAAAGSARLPVMPVVADLEHGYPFAPDSFDCVVNISYLDRELVPILKRSLRVGGLFFFDTFLIDQRAAGHPRDPRFLLQHHELRELLSDMVLLRYREGLTIYTEDKRAWRATALARRV
jgi:tellurite methyltransferase